MKCLAELSPSGTRVGRASWADLRTPSPESRRAASVLEVGRRKDAAARADAKSRSSEELKRYFEPFVGGAALFFDMRAQRPDMTAFLSDVNAELVNCYVEVRDHVDGVIRELGHARYESDTTTRFALESGRALAGRAGGAHDLPQQDGVQRPLSGEPRRAVQRAVRPVHERRCSATKRTCARARRRCDGVSIENGDFSAVLDRRAKKGDFVYFDPPYVPVSPTSDFTAYIPGGFGANEQRKLAKVFAELASKRSPRDAVEFGHAVRSRALRGLHDRRRLASRSVNSNIARRGKLPEVVVRSYGKKS